MILDAVFTEMNHTINGDFGVLTRGEKGDKGDKGDPGICAIICDASGEHISLKDSTDDLLRGLTLYGNTTQQSYSGKNLFHRDYEGTQTTNGVTFSWDAGHQEIVLNGTVSANGDLKLVNPLNLNWVVGETYTISVRHAGGTASIANATEGGSNFGWSIFSNDLKNYMRGALGNTQFPELYSFSGKAIEASGGGYVFYLQCWKVGTVFNNYRVKVQIEKGSTVTEWESYVGGIPSPNPDYPQELVSPGDGGNIGVMVAGKNLFPHGELSVNEYDRYYFDKPLPPGTYTVSALINSTDTDQTQSKIRFLNKEGALVAEQNLGRNVRTSATVTTTAVTHSVRLHAGTTTGNSVGDSATWKDIQIEMGDVATVYEPYNPVQTITAFTDGGLRGFGDIKDEIDFASGVLLQRTHKKIFDGTESFNNLSSAGTKNNAFIYNIIEGDSLYPRFEDGSPNVAVSQCSHFVSVGLTSSSETIGHQIRRSGGAGSARIGFRPPNVENNTIDTFKAWVKAQYDAGTPLTVVYPLATHIDTPLSEAELSAFAALHTHKPNTSIFNDGDAPMSVEYYADTKTYIDNKFNELAAAIVNNT